MNREPDLGEKALDKAAEVALTSQLDEVKQVDVDIRTNPAKVMQGKVDSIAITGEGMVMKQELRVEAAEIHADEVAINPLKVVFGEIELTQPTNAKSQILLTEADLNRALASDYLRSKMKGLRIEDQENPVTVDIQRITLHLLDDGKVSLDIDISINETNEKIHFMAIAKPLLKENGQRIDFEILSAEGEGLSLEFVTALFKQVVDLLDLRKFELDGVSLRLKDLDVCEGRLLLRADTTIEKLPNS